MSNTPSTSPAFEWPDRDTLRNAVEAWAEDTGDAESRLLRAGYVDSFDPEGSEVDSHLDVVLIVESTDLPPAERGADWDLAAIPVPTQALVFTHDEWTEVMKGSGWLARKMEEDTVWVYGDEGAASG